MGNYYINIKRVNTQVQNEDALAAVDDDNDGGKKTLRGHPSA